MPSNNPTGALAFQAESEAVLKLFAVVKRASQWHMMVDGREPCLIRHDDRDFIVQIASDLAAGHDDSVSVYAEDGQLLYTLRFKDGVAVHVAIISGQ